MHSFIYDITPPFITKLYLRFFKKSGWFGNYSSWEEAEKKSEGYDNEIIYDKVLNATLHVKNNPNCYERDSVIFSPIEYHYPVLANLLWIAQQSGNNLHVIDFGGALGSTYFQHKFYFDTIESFSWNVIEQDGFVERGKQYIETDKLHFYSTIEECLTNSKSKPNVLLLSSVLQYLPDPYKFIEQFINFDFDYILIDRTAFIEGNTDRITIQKVFKSIYPANYPARFFNEEKFIHFFVKKYEIEAAFDSVIDTTNISTTYYKGFLFKLKHA